MENILIILFSYFCGSIPFGLIITKLFTKKDIRKTGSGNIGATNVLRSGNKTLALLTLLLDILKGFLPAMITMKYFPELVHISCLLAFLGHVFPIWLKFKGGKGVATYLGILFALNYQLAFLFIFTWVILSLIFKYSSLSSIFSSLTVFIITFVRENALSIISQIPGVTKNIESLINLKISLIMFIFFILIMFTHKKNIYNLKNNSEPKIKI
tara:strand:- start:45 stop:680 length:636 start_codon:yes stop_codon:yes gene_type:complete